MPAIHWMQLTNSPVDASNNPVAAGTMLLMPNGQDLVLAGGTGWDLLTPDSAGNYVNGTFSVAAPFLPAIANEFASNVLPSGQVFTLGGGPSPGSYSEEIYTLMSNQWSPAAAHPGVADNNGQSGVYNDASTALLPPDSEHPAGSILAGGTIEDYYYVDADMSTVHVYYNGPETYLFDIATGTWSQTANKLHGDGFDEEELITLPDNSVLSYDRTTDSDGFPQAQRYIQYGAPLPGSGTSTGQWVDASNHDSTITSGSFLVASGEKPDGPTMVRLPVGGMTLPSGATLPGGAVFAMGSNGKTAFYIPPSSAGATDDYWTAGPDMPSGVVADEASAAVLPNGKVLLVLGDGDSTAAAQLYEFDPTGSGPIWTPLTSGTSGFTTAFPDAGLPNDVAWRLLVNPNGHVLVSNGGDNVYDFYDDSGTVGTNAQPTITSFTRNTSVADNTTYTLTGTMLTGADEGSTSLDEANMSSNYPIVALTSKTNGNVYYATTYGWTPGIAEGSSTVQVVLPRNLPQDDYAVTVIANGVASSNSVDFGGTGGVPWNGPIYVDTHFTTAIYPTGFIPDADPVLAGSQSATIGTNAFNTVTAGIAAAAADNTWVIVNGANGDSGSGVFSEDVVDTTSTLLYLQQGQVTFGSLAGTSGATVDVGGDVDLAGVSFVAGTDDNSTTYDGLITTVFSGLVTSSGTFTKDGSGTMTLGGTDSVATTTVSGGVIQLGTANVLADTYVVVDTFHGLDFNSFSTATLGALGGTGDIFVGSTAVTVGGDNEDADYTGDFSDTASSITKIGTGTWQLGGDNHLYTGGVTVNAGTLELDSTDAVASSTVTVQTSTVDGSTFTPLLTAPNPMTGPTLTSAILGGLAGDSAVVMYDTDFYVGGDDATTTFSGTILSDTGAFEKDGTGTLEMTGTGGGGGSTTTTVASGTLALGANGGGSVTGGSFTVAEGATLEFIADNGPGSPAYSSLAVTLDGGTMSVDAGIVVDVNADVTGESSTIHGYLGGSGTFETDPTITAGTMFTHITANVGPTIYSQNAADQFIDFDNSATLTFADGLNPSVSTTTTNLNGFTNEGAGSVTIGAGAAINVADFTSYGTLTLTPGPSTGAPTVVTNTGSTELDFETGSETFVGTPETADPTGMDILDYVDLHGHNGEVHKALFANYGGVFDTLGSAHLISDGYNTATSTASLVKGTGFFQNSPTTINGGVFRTGDCPGSATLGNLAFGPDGVLNYLFEIDDSNGVAGPQPDAAGHVDGWNLANVLGDFTFAADADNPLIVELETLVNPTTLGTDVSGSMANFDPSQSYVWVAVHWTGTYTGPTDAATLNADTDFDTGGFVNAAGGKFSWRLDTAAKTLSLVYTPPPAVAAVQLNDDGSGVQSMTVTFSAAVNFAGGNAAAAFRLTNAATGAVVSLSATVSTDIFGRTVVTLTFGDGVDLGAGQYNLTVFSSAVTGADGSPLDGIGGGASTGADFTHTWTIG